MEAGSIVMPRSARPQCGRLPLPPAVDHDRRPRCCDRRRTRGQVGARVPRSALRALAGALVIAAVVAYSAPPAPAQEIRLPLKEGSVRFMAMGDTGTGSLAQYEVGKQMAAFHAKFPFT